MNDDYYIDSINEETCKDIYIDSLQPLRKPSKLQLSRLSVSLYVLSIPMTTYSLSNDVAQELSSHQIVDTCVSYYDGCVDLQLPGIEGNIFLSTLQTSEQIEQKMTYKRLLQSYRENVKSTDDVSYYNIFSKLAEELKILPIQSELVSISHIDETINFTLYLGKKMMLSVAKAISQQENDHVMFSIALEKNILVVDRMPLHLLVEKVKDVYSKIG